MQLRELDHDTGIGCEGRRTSNERLPVIATKFDRMRRVSCQDRRNQVAGGALTLRPRHANAPATPKESKGPLWLANQDWTAKISPSCQWNRPSGELTKVVLYSGVYGWESQGYRGTMHDQVRIGEEGCEVLGITE